MLGGVGNDILLGGNGGDLIAGALEFHNGKEFIYTNLTDESILDRYNTSYLFVHALLMVYLK